MLHNLSVHSVRGFNCLGKKYQTYFIMKMPKIHNIIYGPLHNLYAFFTLSELLSNSRLGPTFFYILMFPIFLDYADI